MNIAQRAKPGFDMMKNFSGVKGDLKRLTGSHATYYDVLGYHGYAKSDQIPTIARSLKVLDEMKQVFNDAMQQVQNR